MKKNLFLSLSAILLFYSVLFCEEKDQSERQHYHRIGISPGYITSLNLGMGYTYNKNNKFREKFNMLHAGTNVNHPGDIVIVGFYGKTNYYTNDETEGIFYNTTFGLDVIKMPVLNIDPGGAKDSDESNVFIFPNARIGIGFASKFTEKSGLEVNFELGITAVIMSLNIAYVF